MGSGGCVLFVRNTLSVFYGDKPDGGFDLNSDVKAVVVAAGYRESCATLSEILSVDPKDILLSVDLDGFQLVGNKYVFQ